MRILYVGPCGEGGTCLQRKRALEDLGHEVTSIDTLPLGVIQKTRTVRYRVLNRIGYPPDIGKANRQIGEYGRRACYDILWVDKGVTVSRETLNHFRKTNLNAAILSYSPDDMLNRRNCSKRYRASISSYDIHITTKSYNVDELISLGARRVRFIQNGYDPATHRPVVLTPNDRSLFETDVVFIGQWERARQLSLETLIRTIPDIKLRVWGPGWKHVPKGSNLWPCLMMRSVYGSEYAKAICASKICLGFLSKANRDLQTTRSIEIPACEGFLLAERTDEHLNLFQENTEVEFFDCDEELCFKVQYYLAHENQRRQIALNGRIRCLRSGYSNQALLASVLREITSV